MRFIAGLAAWTALTLLYPLVLYVKHLCTPAFFIHFFLIPVFGILALSFVRFWRVGGNAALTGVLIGFSLPIVLAFVWYLINPSFENSAVFFEGFVTSIPNAIGGGLASWLLGHPRPKAPTAVEA